MNSRAERVAPCDEGSRAGAERVRRHRHRLERRELAVGWYPDLRVGIAGITLELDRRAVGADECEHLVGCGRVEVVEGARRDRCVFTRFVGRGPGRDASVVERTVLARRQLQHPLGARRVGELEVRVPAERHRYRAIARRDHCGPHGEACLGHDERDFDAMCERERERVDGDRRTKGRGVGVGRHPVDVPPRRADQQPVHGEAVAVGVQREPVEIDPHSSGFVAERAQAIGPGREERETERVPAAERVDAAGCREMLTIPVAQGHTRHAEMGEEHGSDATGRECDRRLALKLLLLRGHASPRVRSGPPNRSPAARLGGPQRRRYFFLPFLPFFLPFFFFAIGVTSFLHPVSAVSQRREGSADTHGPVLRARDDARSTGVVGAVG